MYNALFWGGKRSFGSPLGDRKIQPALFSVKQKRLLLACYCLCSLFKTRTCGGDKNDNKNGKNSFWCWLSLASALLQEDGLCVCCINCGRTWQSFGYVRVEVQPFFSLPFCWKFEIICLAWPKQMCLIENARG